MDGVLPIPAEFLKSFLGDNYGIILGPTYLRLRPNPDIAALDSALTRTVHTKNTGIDSVFNLSEIHTRCDRSQL